MNLIKCFTVKVLLDLLTTLVFWIPNSESKGNRRVFFLKKVVKILITWGPRLERFLGPRKIHTMEFIFS